MSDTLLPSDQARPLDAFEDDFDPDLDISKSRDRVWLVKLPKWLLDHWSKTDQDNVELARINIPYSFFMNIIIICSATSNTVNGSVYYPSRMIY